MASGPHISARRLAIDKANARMIAVVGVAAFVAVFCLVASNTVWGTTKYQNRLLKAEKSARDQIKSNIASFDALQKQYDSFIDRPLNIIGGSSLDAGGDKDGDNAAITLDALPKTYDFPALASSLEKLLNTNGLRITGIGGTDDQLAQQGNTSSAAPQAIPIPFTFNVSGDYASIQVLIQNLEKSIRPVVIDTMQLSGAAANMQLSVTAHTFYQPGKTLSVTSQVVK